jgi:hypothetical protein
MSNRSFLRLIGFGACALALLGARVGLASELDPTTGKLKSTDSKAVMIGFEDAAQLASLGVALTKFQASGGGFSSTLIFVDTNGTAMTADELQAHLAPDAAVEGKQALLLGSSTTDTAAGILIPWTSLSSVVTSTRIQITAWVRSSGATPQLVVTWLKDAKLPAAGTFVTLTAIRTGRETSDGWAEISTGPIDTTIWGVPIAEIRLNHGSSDVRNGRQASLVVDALEIAPAGGTAVPPSACSIATQDKDCGDDGECQFGHCVPAYTSWGPVPSLEHRIEFVDRWISVAEHIQGARNSAKKADALQAAKPVLTAATIGGHEFFSRMMGLVNNLRNHHTSFGEPSNAGLLQPLAAGGSSSTLGACLGVGELDLLETPGQQQLGFIVYKVSTKSLVGATLKVGDAITKIDGIDPLTWVRSVFLTWSPGVPADPGADLGWSATGVAWMISHRANNVEVTRCLSATDCTGANKQVTTIDVAGPAWKSLNGTGLLGNENDPSIIMCDIRFQEVVTQSSGSQDAVSYQTIWNDTLGVAFDGTLADFAAWQSKVLAAFPTATPPTKVLFDVRQGNGGYAENSEMIAEQIRAKTDPIGVVGFQAACWDRSDNVSTLMSTIMAASPSCETLPGLSFTESAPCAFVVEDYILGDYYAQVSKLESTVKAFTPAGLNAKVAWLHTANVSANDYMAALVQGRTNQRIFGPGPTSGAYGFILTLPAMLLGWRGGSIQMSDSIWGTSHADIATQQFRSGTGVPPDQVTAQKMSDAINNVDTMLAAAKAWLEANP